MLDVMGFLLDTNVVSEFAKAKSSRDVDRFVAAQPHARIFTSDVVMAELVVGVERMRDATEKSRLTKWLNMEVRPMFDDRVLCLTESCLVFWRRLVAEGRRQHLTYSEPDTLIAATALSHRMVVVTRDWKPFDRVGAPTINPWNATYRAGGGSKPNTCQLEDPTLLESLTSP